MACSGGSWERPAFRSVFLYLTCLGYHLVVWEWGAWPSRYHIFSISPCFCTCPHAYSLARETAIVSLSLCNSADDGRRRFQVHMAASLCTWQHMYARGVRIHVRGVSICMHMAAYVRTWCQHTCACGSICTHMVSAYMCTGASRCA